MMWWIQQNEGGKSPELMREKLKQVYELESKDILDAGGLRRIFPSDIEDLTKSSA